MATISTIQCYHCGEDCPSSPIRFQEKHFCCEGCKTVYSILNREGLCAYYDLNQAPGKSLREQIRKDKFAFLEEEEMASQLIDFKDETQSQTLLYLPQIHCSSCLWLLENLHKLNPGIVHSKVDFTRKELRVLFRHGEISLRQLAELLASIGYEPYIRMKNPGATPVPTNRPMLLKLGVAGFCFANIMLMSFPEYLGMQDQDAMLGKAFRWMNLLLALPVFFYSAMEFHVSAWKSLKSRYLNIDAPISLALIVTFIRSIYEIISGTGAGYLDSMSGIVFFMLAGRVLQDRTYRKLSFERDFTSYFPLSATVVKDKTEKHVSLQSVQLNDTLLIHHGELIPADGILTRGKALIDYSFVTGESLPVEREMGELLYAGGKQMGGNIEVLVIREVTQSYLTSLWNRNGDARAESRQYSLVETISRYFTYCVLAIAAGTGIYWYFNDAALVWNAVTAVLIVACPCALLLCHSFTNGNMLRILSRMGLYVKNASVLEKMASIDVIVFDKTGTLTSADAQEVRYEGSYLCEKNKSRIAALAGQSAHPRSKAIVAFLSVQKPRFVQGFKEHPGLGIEGIVEGDLVSIGSWFFLTGQQPEKTDSAVYIAIESKVLGRFHITNEYRNGLERLAASLKKRFQLALLSGDNEQEKPRVEELLGTEINMRFSQKPDQKQAFVESLQQSGKNVMMVGDGLNDAAALQSSAVGVAVTDDANLFTPASSAILEGKALPELSRFLLMARAARNIVLIAFGFSLLYNIIGIAFAVSGTLEPMVAAVLMPASSLTILLITYGLTSLLARKKHD